MAPQSFIQLEPPDGSRDFPDGERATTTADPERADTSRPRGGFAALGITVVVVGCCAGLPLVAAVAGSVAFTTLLGAGLAGAIAVAGAGVLLIRVRRPRGCALPDVTTPTERRSIPERPASTAS